MGMRDQIRRRYEGWKKPFDALWKWATRPKKAQQKSNRFKALRAWTWDKIHLARKHKLGTVREWQKRRRIYAKKAAFFQRRADKHQEQNQQEATNTSGVALPDRPWNP